MELSEVKFSDEREKAAFEKVLAGDGNFLEFFFISGNGSYEESQLHQFKSSFYRLKNNIQQTISSKKANKKLKIIYKEVHSRFFMKYQLKCSFLRS